MRSALRVPVSVVSLCLVACAAHRAGDPLAPLTRAASGAAQPGASARTLALSGFQALLVAGDVTRAETSFEHALKIDPGEPYALLGEMLVARHDGHPERSLAVALDLLERAPRHPLAVAAARSVGDLAGVAPPLDDVILQRGPVILSKGLRSEAAYLLRGAMAGVLMAREPEARAQTLAAMGTPTEVTLLGPLSPFQVLAFDASTPVEKTGSVVGATGPLGPVAPRTLTFPDGRLNLSGEGPLGDMFVFAADLDVPADGPYVLRAAAAAPFKVYVDGELLLERRPFERATSTVLEQGVSLGSGKHRMRVKIGREERSPVITLSLFREDGAPSALKFAAAKGAAPRAGDLSRRDAELVFPRAADLEKALEDEAGQGLATYLAVRDGMNRDRDAAKALLAELKPFPKGPAWTSLRAELTLGDRTIPAKVARGRATRDLEVTLEEDKTDVPALLERASLMLDEQRLPQAVELLKQARAAHAPVGYPVLALEARVDLALGVDAQADLVAQEALKAQPALCEAMALRYDLALRRDAIAAADALLAPLSACTSERTRAPEHAKTRGQPDEASRLYEQLLARDPTDLPLTNLLTNMYLAQRRFEDALKMLASLRTAWPHNPSLLKRTAEVLELAGKKDEALRLREEALQLDGSDLSLRRSVERARTGKELLQDQAISGDAAIRYYEAHHGEEDAAATYVLDAAAIRAYPDGSMVDRIHIVQKVLDQSGVSEAAELTLPPGAQVLTLRTRKADGSVLEPESIEGKETVSLPGVAVGDYVEYEYLYAHPSRGPGEPGFTASPFFFQIGRIPDTWATYTVIAPKGSHMGVDAHNLRADAPKPQGNDEVFFHEERRMPPYIPEPEAPPAPTEYLPFVSVGAGTTGNEASLALYADGFLDRGALTTEVEAFAHEAVGDKKDLEAVKAIYAAVMKRLNGRDAGLVQSAAGSLAQDRGSRLWLIKASLEAVGIPARLAAVRLFSSDPAVFTYPNESLVPYICVRAEVPGAGAVWLDPLVRFAPFGELPESASGGREAWLLPEPGRPLQKLVTPPSHAPRGKRVQVSLTVGMDGSLTGSGDETYEGFEAAQLGESLEQLPPAERNQALQGALARYFSGAALTELKLSVKREVGAPLSIHYAFKAPHFARLEGNQLTVPPITFPAHLGQRYVQVSSRKTPLYIDSTEESHSQVTLNMPPGFVLGSPVTGLKQGGKFGSFSRNEAQQGGVLKIEENYKLPMARIPVAQYDDFSQFAGEVDLIQGRDLILEKRTGK